MALGADPHLTTHRSYGVPRPEPTPELMQMIEEHLHQPDRRAPGAAAGARRRRRARRAGRLSEHADRSAGRRIDVHADEGPVPHRPRRHRAVGQHRVRQRRPLRPGQIPFARRTDQRREHRHRRQHSAGFVAKRHTSASPVSTQTNLRSRGDAKQGTEGRGEPGRDGPEGWLERPETRQFVSRTFPQAGYSSMSDSHRADAGVAKPGGYNTRAHLLWPAIAGRSVGNAKEAAMSESVTERGLKRREFMSYALALGGMAAAASVVGPSSVWGAVSHRPLDPVNPDILFGSTSSLWSGQHDIEWAIKRIAALGLQGIEPYADQIEKYRSNPLALKKLFDDAGLTMIDVSNGAKGQSTNFIDPGSDPENHCRSCGVRARLSPAVRLHPLEVQHGRPAARWSERRSAQAARQHPQRDRPANDRHGDQAGAASSYLGTHGARTRCAPGDGAHRSQICLAHHRHRASDPGRHGCGADHERLLPAHRRSAPQGHLRQVSRQHRPRRRRSSTTSRACITIWAAAASTSRPSSNCCATGTTRAGRFSTWTDRERATTASTPSAETWISPSMTIIAHNINYLRVMLGVRLPPLG